MYVQIQPLATCSLFCCPSHIPNVVPDFPKMSWIMCHNHSKASLTIHEKNKSQNNPSTEARLNVSLQVLKPRYLPMKKMQNEKSLYLKLQMVKASLTVRAHRLTNRLSKHQISKNINQPTATHDHAFMGDGVCGDPAPTPTPAHSPSLRIEQSHGMLQTTRILASCFCLSRISFKARVIQQSFNGHPSLNFQKSLGEDPSWEFLRLEQSLCKNETGFWSMDSRDKDLQTKMC